AALGAAGHARSRRHEIRLRHRAVQRVHRACERGAGAVLSASRAVRRRHVDHDDRRHCRRGRHPASGPAGLDRRGRRAVRLLPGRADHERSRAARADGEADGCGHRRGDVPAPVPLRHVQPDPQSDSRRRRPGREDGERGMSGRSDSMNMNPYLPEFMQKAAAEAAHAPVSRRQFMKIAGFAGGGLVLGFTIGPKASAQENGHGAHTNATFAPNAYVQITPDGTVVLYAKNPDVGQGVKTALPMIVAEELDADWSKVRVEQAPISMALYGAQFAGGSMSVPMNFDTPRRAGPVARAMLVAAAAERLGVAASELSTDAGYVVHQASGRRVGYGELAEAAAKLPVPDAASVTLKDRKDFKLLGKRITGVDNLKVVTGQPMFGIDQRVPGMLYATYTKAPAIGARAVSANLDHVKSLPGVKDAFLVEQRGNPIEFSPAADAILSGVAIVADSTWAALKAKRELEVEWDESAASKDSWSGAVAEAKRLAAEAPQQTLGETGDVDAAFANAEKTVEGFYTYPFVSHADLEPQNCTVWCKDDGTVEIWAPTQTPQNAVTAVAALLGVPQDDVTLHQLRGGGGF